MALSLPILIKKHSWSKMTKVRLSKSHVSEVAISVEQKLCSWQVSCGDSGDDTEDENESDNMSVAETSVRMDLYSL